MRIATLFVTLALIGAVALRPAHADTARAQARKAFAAGEAADARKAYRDAIEHYLQAYELVPHHFALYNIGVDYERLGEYREAAAWFQRYLQSAPPSAESDRVQRLLIELKLRPAKLTVKTNVAGVRVFVDGQYAGRTPFEKPVRGGGRRIRVELSGQRDERDVYLEYGEPKEIEFTLRTVKPRSGPTGTLDIGGAPDGAQVQVDGQPVGRLPSVRVPAIPGTHQIDVTKYGYQPWGASVEVQIDQVTPVQVLMVREGDPPIATGQPGATPSQPDVPGQPGGLGTPPVADVLVAGYMLGVGGGADLRGNGSLFLVDLGIRARKYDASVRYGKTGDLYAIDVLVRAALFDRPLSPFLGGGYSFLGGGTSMAGGGSGLELVGGVRFDFSRTSSGIATLLLETGLRYHADVTLTGSTTRSGLVIPLLASVQYTYGRRR